MTYANFDKVWKQSLEIDRVEGCLAYSRYNEVMVNLAQHWQLPLNRVVAVFVSLSPNSDYMGNLRSTVSVLKAVSLGHSVERIQVSTYRHCLLRAYAYATGQLDFAKVVRGPKIFNFYHNILNPADTRYVTIDGHMSALWQGQNLTMKEATVRPTAYGIIATDLKSLAFANQMAPCQMQAILWFTRKRMNNILYNPQLSLFAASNDSWRTLQTPDNILPYPERNL